MSNNPDNALREFINDNFSITKTDVYPTTSQGVINPAWYEKSRSFRRQIYIQGSDSAYSPVTEHKQLELDATESPRLSTTIRYVYVAAPNRSQRQEMFEEMLRIFDPKNELCLDYTSDDGTLINEMLLINDFDIDKDSKNDVFSWIKVLEIHLNW